MNDFSNLVNAPFYGPRGAHSKQDRNKQERKKALRTDIAFNKYCKSNITTYGVQIKCSTISKAVNFMAGADSNLKCRQTSFGVNSDYPNVVSLSDDLLDDINNCNGNVTGPNKVTWVDIKTMPNNSYSQYNHTDTYYDIICPNKITIESDVYIKLQANLDNNKKVMYNTCVSTNMPQAHNFIIMFYVCIIIAILALALFIYKRKKSKNV